MSVPTSFADLSTTVASNSPAGSENVFPDLDDYLRFINAALASIKANTATNGWVSPYLATSWPASPDAIGTSTPAAGTFTALVATTGTFSNALRVTGPYAAGYDTGSGGTVTQATSKSTSVTLNKPTGQITMNNAELADGTTARFTVNNSLCSASDVPSAVLAAGSASASYQVTIDGVGVGGFSIAVRNVTGGSLSEAIVINFSLGKGATS